MMMIEKKGNKILLVEDNELILFNTKLMLEMHEYEVMTASNGLEALKFLNDTTNEPDIIVSDIMMPNMNGYTFYNKISENSHLSLIPFIFMSAKSSPEDVRFGKKLGVDDYITKPFEEEDLLAIIEGKITRSERTKNLREKFEKELVSLLSKENEHREPNKGEVLIFIIDWDESIGPTLKDHYPTGRERMIFIDDIGLQLYNTSISIYGSLEYSNPEGTLIRMNNFELDACIFFDAADDQHVRGGQRLYMVVVVADHIHYLESLRIQELSKKIAIKYRQEEELNMKEYHSEILDILS